MRVFLSLTIATAAFLAIATVASAAELYLQEVRDEPGPGFTVQAMMAYDVAVNAVEGTLRFDPAVLEVAAVSEGESGIPVWIERPHLQAAGEVVFAGIVPGGLRPGLTDRVPLFTVTFRALRVQSTTVVMAPVQVLTHEAEPQQDPVRSIPFHITITREDLGEPELLTDTIPPEPFSISIIGGTAVDFGAPAAVFATRDLQSGLRRFEIRERILGWPTRWRSARSPTLLSPWWGISIIEARAVDNAGNVRAARTIPWTFWVVWFGFLVLLLMMLRNAARRLLA